MRIAIFELLIIIGSSKASKVMKIDIVKPIPPNNPAYGWNGIAAGKPVVSTSFPHAVELLSSGAGLLVPQRDPEAIGEALRTLLTDPARAAEMARTSRSLAPGLLWPAVADQYVAVGEGLVAEGARSVA